MGDELCFLTIAEASRRIAAGELSPVDLVEAYLDRIAAIDPQLDAFLTLTADLARKQARAAAAELAQGRRRGPLHGIPFGLKDIYETAGIRTTGHSRVMADHVPAADATTVARLYDAGAILLGKLATHEFAHGGPSFDLPWPPARNPWDTGRVTGGSSSGSGAAVAAGMLPAALGSDTGGSIRNPASLCGVVGLKPTYGLVSRAGVVTNSYTFDHCGPLTWTVEDAAMMLQALAGHDPRDPASARVDVPDYRAGLTESLKGLRVGVVRQFYEVDQPATPATRAALEAAYDVLRGLGASVSDVRLRPLQDYYDVKITIAESELYAVHEAALRTRPGDFGADFLGRVLPACLMSGTDYVAAQRERRSILSEMEAVYARFDLFVTAAAVGPATRFDGHRTLAFWEKPSLATPFNVTGGPALVQCIGFDADGLPLSMQIAGRPFDDATVLRAGHAYEAATGWRDRRPQLEPGAPKRPVDPPKAAAAPADATAADRAWAASAARAAGLDLSESQFAQLLAAAPHVAAMVGRLRRSRPFGEEPANIFRFPSPK